MEKLALFGKDSEHLVKVITDQVQFNSTLNPSALYDEIIDTINKLDGFSIVKTFHLDNEFPANPSEVYESDNFRYALEFPVLTILNKYHN